MEINSYWSKCAHDIFQSMLFLKQLHEIMYFFTYKNLNKKSPFFAVIQKTDFKAGFTPDFSGCLAAKVSNARRLPR